jgi:hypothetical protein
MVAHARADARNQAMPSNAHEASPESELPAAAAETIMGTVESQFERLFAPDFRETALAPPEVVQNSE